MKKLIATISLCMLAAGPALADGQNNQNQNQSQAYGNNYSTVTQIGVNNNAAVVQNGSVSGSLLDLGSGNQNQSNVNIDKQAFAIGSIIDSEGATISKTGSDNISISNNSQASIVTPIQ
ncbi:hypothetical protein [Methylocystis sp. SC2]|uniref:hypothetical protein n=1 Tax=Methylocystis sp. (strain SC2) TaxID=187303 RepID=UPI00027AE735|nr:hypothetical protein [Methylocystis sp. SC2]CCJ06678.1 Hypothetical protein BN69_1227 [Methylocystis sp. SC2]